MQVIFATAPQQHGFNFPYQLGCREIESEEPEQSDIYSVPIQEGDIIVAGTDGLFDNLFDEDIELVAHYVSALRRAVEAVSRGALSLPLRVLSLSRYRCRPQGLQARRCRGRLQSTS